MSALLTLLLALLPARTPVGKPAAAPSADAPRRAAPNVVPDALRVKHADADCDACHHTSTWSEVRFNHERTGFPLTGRHQSARCRGCHGTDFTRPLARTCSACHVDVHAQELGARCESCHDTANWKSRFDAEGHRRTNFPLLGGHAALPCSECHAEAAERRFSRTTVACGSCHQADYQRTSTGGLDHRRSGFDHVYCQACHDGFRFKPARYPNHACFPLTGPHQLTCAECHRSSAILRKDPTRTCSTGTVVCVACHEHECAILGNPTDTFHQSRHVPGYGTTCSSTKCVACHGVR